MKKTILALAFMFSANAYAEPSVGLLYHAVSRHVKISDVSNPYGDGSYSAEFDVGTSRYGIFDSTGILMSAIGGAANQENARRKAIENAHIPKGKTSTTVEYSWKQPHYVDVMAYIAMYSSANSDSVTWSYSSDWDKFFAYPSGGASMSGFDVGAPLPFSIGLLEPLGVTIAPIWEINVHNYTFGGKKDTMLADPLSLNFLYQDTSFPWVVGQAHFSYSPLMGLMGATLGGLPQMYGYGFGVMAPLGPLTLEANYDKFNGAFIGGTGSKGTPVESSSWFIGGRFDVVAAYLLLMK